MAGRVLSAAAGKSILLIALTLCACSCSNSDNKSGSSGGRSLDDGIKPEARARVEKELTEGPTEDTMSAEARATLEKRFGPVLPQIPFRSIRSFPPDKVGRFVRTTLVPESGLGFPTIMASYKDENESQDGWAVVLRIIDGRQEKGGTTTYMNACAEERGKRRDPNWKPDWKTETIKGFVASVQDRDPKFQWIAVKVGRFEVFVQASDMKVVRQFLDAIDLEKLSKTE